MEEKRIWVIHCRTQCTGIVGDRYLNSLAFTVKKNMCLDILDIPSLRGTEGILTFVRVVMLWWSDLSSWLRVML